MNILFNAEDRGETTPLYTFRKISSLFASAYMQIRLMA